MSMEQKKGNFLSQVLAFLLALGAGAAPGQRLRRAGEPQRDFGPISSSDLATHFGGKYVLEFQVIKFHLLR